VRNSKRTDTCCPEMFGPTGEGCRWEESVQEDHRRASAAKTRCVMRARPRQAIFVANNCSRDTECPDLSEAMDGRQLELDTEPRVRAEKLDTSRLRQK